ncbi:MAG: hypothetical protein U1E06_07835 [Tabrizicola sp.]|nr:hypothetical protein [Tabrizicola sp.]MDP3263740.1 hypothetical protein [Tabrizicola sp.]MDP3647104.1 hypothetical protein [Paracoccaceae bacterium]MDZ4066752.1 hypothetical protein [Tabrizicola sp.]
MTATDMTAGLATGMTGHRPPPAFETLRADGTLDCPETRRVK